MATGRHTERGLQTVVWGPRRYRSLLVTVDQLWVMPSVPP